jgi:hypothetical protein
MRAEMTVRAAITASIPITVVTSQSGGRSARLVMAAPGAWRRAVGLHRLP